MKKVLEHNVNPLSLRFVSCGYEEGVPTQSYGPAMRSYNMIHFVLKGQGHYYLKGRHYRVKTGQSFFIPVQENNFYHADSDDPWTYCWICFAGADAEAILDHCGYGVFHPILRVSHIEEIHALVDQIMNFYELTPSNGLHIQSLLAEVLALVEENGDNSYLPTEDTDNGLVQKAILFIQDKSDLPITVQEVADHLFISRTYLYSLFKRNMLITPQQFIVNAKISKARELLAKTDEPIADIAHECGYHNQFAFSRAFRREISLSPREYRTMYLRPDKPLDR